MSEVTTLEVEELQRTEAYPNRHHPAQTELNQYSGPKVTDAERSTAAGTWKIRLGEGRKPHPHLTQNYIAMDRAPQPDMVIVSSFAHFLYVLSFSSVSFFNWLGNPMQVVRWDCLIDKLAVQTCRGNAVRPPAGLLFYLPSQTAHFI